MSRTLRLLGLALFGFGDAIAQPSVDVSVTPAWSGWSRPGRATEVEIRLHSPATTRAVLTLVSGRETVRTEVDLDSGRVRRLHVPIGPGESVMLEVAPVLGGTPVRREVRIAHSESPVLGAGLAATDGPGLAGFNTLRLDANDLPRNASAYASIDALLLDAPTMGALDPRQLSALLAHAAACGRTVLVDPDPRALQVLEGAAGCGGRALISAVSAEQAMHLLRASLAAPTPSTAPLAGPGDLARPDHASWNRILVVLAIYGGIALLAFMFGSSIVIFLFVPALATGLAWCALHVMEPESRLLVWAEADPVSRTASYRAWQTFPGLARGERRVPVLAQLGAVRPCEGRETMRLEFDAVREAVVSAVFEARLFQPVTLCYSGHFPVTRNIAIEAADGMLAIRNAGGHPWPAGVLLAGRNVHDLPALGPGETATIATAAGKPAADPAAVTALARSTGPSGLWLLELASVPDAPRDSRAWIFVPVTPP